MTYIISSGNVSSGIILVSHGDNLIISSGGTAYNTTVNSGGGAVIGSGGTAYHTTVNSRGALGVRYGIANITVVNFSGTFAVSSGGTANSTTVNKNGILFVHNGGIANSTTVSSGGCLKVFSGGTASDIMKNGGFLEIKDGATVTFMKSMPDNSDMKSMPDNSESKSQKEEQWDRAFWLVLLLLTGLWLLFGAINRFPDPNIRHYFWIANWVGIAVLYLTGFVLSCIDFIKKSAWSGIVRFGELLIVPFIILLMVTYIIK